MGFGQAKIPVAKLINRVPIQENQFVGTDAFGFQYLISDSVLYKKKETETFEYKNISLGEITKVDLQNPLKIVVFYENFNAVILLDNQLNETQKILFSENENPILVSAIGLASQNQLWIYNSLNQKIGLYDFLKNEYKTISTPLTENIKYYESNFNTFYWIDSKNNWYSSSIFGKTSFLGIIPDFDQIQFINDNQFLFSKNGELFFVDQKTIPLTNVKIAVFEKTFKNFYYKDQILSIFTSKEIMNYKITIP